MCAPEWHPAPDAERPGAGVGVDDRPRTHGRPPNTSGPGGQGSERRASARWRGRCGRNRCSRRMVDLAIGGLVQGAWVDQQGVPGETDVPLAALGVEDPERRPAPRRAVAVVRDERLGSLPDDVAAEPDPRPASQLEPDAGRLAATAVARPPPSPGASRISSRVSARRASAASRWSRSPSLPGCRPRQSTARQVEDEQVDRPTGQQAARDRQPLIEAVRGDHDEPLEVDATGDRLDRVEAARQVEPGHDRALGPGLRATLRLSVVRPLEPSPRIATLADVGRPPGPRIASSAAKPVRMTRSSGRGSYRGWTSSPERTPGPARRRPGCVPHRARRPATAASTSPRPVDIGRPG